MSAAAPPAGGDASTADTAHPRPAGFWHRYLAYSLDWLLLLGPLYLLLATPLARAGTAWQALTKLLQDSLMARVLAAPEQLAAPGQLARKLLADAPLQAALGAGADRLSAALVQATLLATALAALYFIGFEGSRWAATPGKRLLRLQVRAISGQRLSWPRTALRFAAGSLSWLSLNLGHALVGWRRDGRALHDLVAGSQVLAMAPMPRWARGLLYGQLLLLLLGFVLLFGWLLSRLGQLQAGALG